MQLFPSRPSNAKDKSISLVCSPQITESRSSAGCGEGKFSYLQAADEGKALVCRLQERGDQAAEKCIPLSSYLQPADRVSTFAANLADLAPIELNMP